MQPYRPHNPREVYAPPNQPGSPSHEKESQMGIDHAAMEARAAADQVLNEYRRDQETLTNAIESSRYLLGDLRNFNGDQWTIRYPSLRTEGGESSQSQRPGMARRTLTFADEPAATHAVVLNSTPTARRTMKRSLTLAPPTESAGESSSSSSSSALVTVGNPSTRNTSAQSSSDDFSILRLDLNIGAARQARSLISHLERSSISSLLDNRIASALDHLNMLQRRVQDPHSRVLVTGDLNAGKSTLINALLRRNEVMPTDQQPLTTRFVEVVSARENEGREEIHILDGEGPYDPTNPATFSVESIDNLEALATDLDSDASAPPMRVFVNEARLDIANPSILHNGVVDISLIDAPGLNRDSIITTANFARQEEIDVVVFVVSAANHFTLSAKEFIWQAGHEKAHLFIVVNRFDQIRDKERCRRAVLEQIRQLSPDTYEEAADLVHFVDSAKVALGCAEDESADDLDEAFRHLEHSLRSFVLVNRKKSKLGPARHYVTHLLADVELLASANSLVATQEREAAKADLARVKPVLEQMQRGKDGLEESLVQEEEIATERAATRTKAATLRALERIGLGEMAAAVPGLTLPSYPGILGVWDYAKEVKRVLLASVDFISSLAEADARAITTEGVTRVLELGERALPADVERPQRVFNPAAMFTVRPTSKLSRRASGISSVGLGLATRPQLVDVSISDIFDFSHHISLARKQLPSSSSSSQALIPYLPTQLTGPGLSLLGAGVLSVSGKLFGVRTFIDGALGLSDLIAHPMTQRWIGPVVGMFAVGAVGYVVYELPRTIPRNIGRQIQSNLLTAGIEGDERPYAESEADRIGREVRKVMRLAAWDLRERFRGAVDARGDAVRASEESERRATRALTYFESVERRVGGIREQVEEAGPSSKPGPSSRE